MEDVLTETPPPSRFRRDDLDIFAQPSPPLPAPFLVFSNHPKPSEPLRPSVLIVAVSNPSLRILHGLPSKAPIGTLVLPETPFSGNSLGPSPHNKSCDIYALDGAASAMIFPVQVPVAAERSHAVAGALIGGRIVPERVVVFDSVRRRNFRAGLSPDDAAAFRLETSAERKRARGGLKGLEYFPSGSVAEGLGAALLGRCEARRIRGTLCVTWPETGGPTVSLVISLLESVLPGLDLSSCADDAGDEFSGLTRVNDRLFDSELYT